MPVHGATETGLDMSAKSNAPIIVKRKKVIAGGGHHGGAWKVAYADFVTAMMAFFMLMWLLNATTEQQRKGLADYFAPTVAVSRTSGGGDGNFGGTDLMSDDTLVRSNRGGGFTMAEQRPDLPAMTRAGDCPRSPPRCAPCATSRRFCWAPAARACCPSRRCAMSSRS